MMTGTSILQRLIRVSVIGVLTVAGVITPILDAAPAAAQAYESEHDVACDLAVHDHTLCSQLLHGGVAASASEVAAGDRGEPVILAPSVAFTRPSILRTELPARAPPTTRHR